MDTRELISQVEEIMRLVNTEDAEVQFKLTLLKARLKVIGRQKEPPQDPPEGSQYINQEGTYYKRELLGPKRNKVWWYVWSKDAQQWLTVCGTPCNVDKLVEL